ncbi:MAG: hypothetical protein Q4B43_01760 [Bacteroidota bacterium]|nr:hypothetical protein [Bacteroidota bacterium]
MASRQTPELWFDICEENNQNTDILIVISDSEAVVNHIAYFLANETQGEIFDKQNQPINADSLKDKMGDSDLENRLQLAKNSIWRTSSEQNPYPNLKND